MRRSSFMFAALFAVVLSTGCATPRQPSYVFSVPLPRVQEWTQVYPASRDREALKFFLVNGVTGARIDFFSHSSLYREPESVAGELKVRFAQDGASPSEIAAPRRGGPASFRFSDAPRGIAGKVAVFRPTAVRECIVAVGRWPVANDELALADMDLILAQVDAYPEE